MASPGEEAPELSVVVPVYKSAAILPHLVQRLHAVLQPAVASYELLLIDDCSPDDSWNVLRDLQRELPATMRIFRLSRNFGQHNALMCGFKHSRGAYVVTLDDDLQNPPEEIPRLYAKIVEGRYDVVFGYFEERRHSWARNTASRLSRWLIRRAVPGLNPYFSNYRILNRFTVQEIARQTQDFLYVDGLIAWVTHNTGHVVVAHAPRFAGESNYDVRRLVSYFAVVLMTFTVLPLKIVSLVGFLAAAGGLSLGFVYFVMRLAGLITEPGFAAIILAVLVLGGIQLLSLGLIGEYVGKIFLKQSGKPQFIVRESVT